LADPDLIAVLRLLHQSALPDLPAPLAPYRPTWEMATTDRALVALPALPACDAATLMDNLGAMCDAAQPLFAPRCPLSGDPNPANWGLRDDGSLVLFDWERFCRGAPAIDLAITVPGLGDMTAFRQVAVGYSVGQAPSDEAEQMAREIALAKVWSVVEFLAHNAGRGERAGATLAWVAATFGDWLQPLACDLALP
jgi:Ser/Thr protein kinase RdoA (MazF antagonist)